jgi:hypothetical protein
MSSDNLYPVLFNHAGVGLTTRKNHDALTTPFVGSVEIRTPGGNSNIPNKESSDSVDSGRGRRLVATKAVQAGECLFVIDPTVSAPIDRVYKLWSTKAARGCRRTLEEVAEDVLLEQMRECLCLAMSAQASINTTSNEMSMSTSSTRQVASFGLQVGVPDLDDDIMKFSHTLKNQEMLDILVCKQQHTTKAEAISLPKEVVAQLKDNEKARLAIIRRNAFGPDFHNYSTMERTWNASVDDRPILLSEEDCPPAPYRRVLGLYPLAAMINHGCVANAVKVFAGETMIVHASANIAAGEEITWSYIPSSTPYPRRVQVQQKFGFLCHCRRCQEEKSAYELVESLTNLSSNSLLSKLNEETAGPAHSHSPCYTINELNVLKNKIETVLKDNQLSHEVRRYIRVGYLMFYITYFNAALSDKDSSTDHRDDVIMVATQVHFALVSCNNASTEHISILHLIYELTAIMHVSSSDQTKSIVKVRFWTEQLKRAHMIRYGVLGNYVEHVRDIMKHTKIVLRKPNGLQMVQSKFI